MKSLAVASRSFSKNSDLRRQVLQLYPDATFNDEGASLEGDSLVEFLSGHEKAILALEVIDESILSRLPDLQVIGKYGVGLDMIDLDAMHKYGVRLGWTGGVNRRSVSELVVSFAIYLLHRVSLANNEVKRGHWDQVQGRQLTKKTFGIIGCGNIGKDVVKLLEPYNCKVLVNDILHDEDFYRQNNLSAVSLDEIIETSDVISLHVPLNKSTKNLINEQLIKRLKKDAIFINIARGGLVDEVALCKSLINGSIGGAALDVFAIEPPKNCDIANLDNVIVTPHIGGSTHEAIFAMGMAAIEGLNTNYDALHFK
mgnify:CR=1 FL=1